MDNLENWEPKSTSRDSDDVVVDNSDDELVGLSVIVTVLDPACRRSSVFLVRTTVDAIIGDTTPVIVGCGGVSLDRTGTCLGDDRHVGELTVVSRTHGIETEEVEGVGVHVVAGRVRDAEGGVVRVDEGVVVRTHLGDGCVPVDERCSVDRIVVTSTLGSDTSSVPDEGWGCCGIVGVLSRHGRVTHSKEEDLDGVRETDVVAGHLVCGGVVCLFRRSLDLLDKNITRGTGHALTLIVGDNGVVTPHLDVGESRDRTLEIVLTGITDVDTLVCTGGNRRIILVDTNLSLLHLGEEEVLLDKKTLPRTESEVDTHVVVWKGSCWECNTTIATEEEWKRKIECSLGDASVLHPLAVGEVCLTR